MYINKQTKKQTHKQKQQQTKTTQNTKHKTNKNIPADGVFISVTFDTSDILQNYFGSSLQSCMECIMINNSSYTVLTLICNIVVYSV